MADQYSTCYIAVTESETEDPIEVPSEEDGRLLLTTLQGQFPQAVGLKFRNPETRAFRGVRIADGVLYPPEDGWQSHVFVVNFAKVTSQDNKRKMEDGAHAEVSKTKRPTPQCSDLVVLGLPFTFTVEDLREFFSQYGELSLSEVKKGPDGNSRGFGFVRYTHFEDQKKVQGQIFEIEGRKVQVKKPHSQQQGKESNRIFVGRLNSSISKDDLHSYFSLFGNVQEVYYDQPGGKQFGFITFEDAEVATCVLSERNHLINGVQVSVNTAEPMKSKTDYLQQQQMRQQQRENNQNMGGGAPPNNYYQPMSPTGSYSTGQGNGQAYPPNAYPPVPRSGREAYPPVPPAGASPQMDPALFGQEMLNAMAKMMAGAMNNNMGGASAPAAPAPVPPPEVRHPGNPRSPPPGGASAGLGYRPAYKYDWQ